tara:strand:+ start:674 stop:1096 length:423 start_codon:yes stop_codon:yes gene_type:complete
MHHRPVTGEVPIYQAPGVWISKQRAVFGQQTYAMAQLSAVSAYTQIPNRPGPIVFIVLGFLFTPAGGLCTVGGEIGLGLGMLVLGLALLVAGVAWWYLQKPTYIIWLNTSGGQVQALWSHDWPYISSVHRALQHALIQRG